MDCKIDGIPHGSLAEVEHCPTCNEIEGEGNKIVRIEVRYDGVRYCCTMSYCDDKHTWMELITETARELLWEFQGDMT